LLSYPWRAKLAPMFLAFLLAQAAPAAAPTPASEPVRVALDTSEGRIVLALDREHAPITAGNFLRYIDGKRLDGIVFYRTVKVGPQFGFVQFGVQNAPKRVLPPIRHEATSQTGIKHLNGTISTARNAPGTAQGDFTISVGDQPSLDAGSGQPEDNLGYAAFGRVVEGMDVIGRILDAPAKPGGHFVGQELAVPVKVISARRLPQ
jgi:peptidyl-prolyl cis-trans isomerase A (cyclophilin A)